MNNKQAKEFGKEFKSLTDQIQNLLIKYGAGPGSFYVTTIGIKEMDFNKEERDEVLDSILGSEDDDANRIDVFYSTNVSDCEELEEILDNVYYAHNEEMKKERKMRVMKNNPPEKGTTTAQDWINMN